MKQKETVMLIGNSFPFTLIRRAVRVVPESLADVRRKLATADVHSYWGHAGTLSAVRALLGVDLTPKGERPAIVLSPDGYPTLDGETFREVYVCSPTYAAGFRPPLGADVPADKITSWQMLRIIWE